MRKTRSCFNHHDHESKTVLTEYGASRVEERVLGQDQTAIMPLSMVKSSLGQPKTRLDTQVVCNFAIELNCLKLN